MKDIKSLYLTAKSSGKQADISAYSEAIQELIKDDPNGYVTQLEYIISSSIGLDTMKPFIEQNGLPIACYDPMMNVLSECIRKCEVYGKDASAYNEMVQYLESFRAKYINCFMMYENYSSEMKPNYVSTYYRKNEKGFQNNRLIAGMITHFGEGAIPDALITADLMGAKAVRTVLEYVWGKYDQNSRVVYEWLLAAANDISDDNRPTEILEQFREQNSVSRVINDIKRREHQAFRESVILGTDEASIEYSESEIQAIRDMISFKEYQLTWADELHESTKSIQNEIYGLYEMLDGVVTPEGDIDEDAVTFQEGMVGGALLAAPIVFAAGALIAGMVSYRVMQSKHKKRVLKDLSEITGEKVKSTKEYIDRANKYFADMLKKHEKSITGIFYKYDVLDESDKLNKDPKVHFAYDIKADKSDGDQLILSSNDVVAGLVKSSSLKTIYSKLNKLDPLIKVGFTMYGNDLPGDDSGGDWYIFTKAGICEGGPEEYKGDDDDDAGYQKWIEEQINRIEKSGYEVVRLYLYMDAKTFIQENFNESLSIVNTRNKKTGDIPAYLANNHDIDYGEEDTTKKKSVPIPTPSSDPSDDYRRPSATDKPGSQVNLPSAFHSKDDSEHRTSGNSVSEDDKRVINNYYYTYTNSLNKNTNSFNKDHSVRDNHSVTKDDHSKTVNSHNVNTPDPEIGEDEKPEDKTESSKPWELNIFNDLYFQEGIKDFFRKMVSKIKGYINIKKSLANLQNMDIPANSKRGLPPTIPGTNIPLNRNQVKTESYEEAVEVTDNLERLLENGYVITEDTEDPFLSKKDVKNVINKLRSKFNADIIFLSGSNNPAIVATVGPAACIRTNRETLKKLAAGKHMDNIEPEIYGNREGLETVILVNPKMIRDFNIRTPRDLEIILSHEYGHVLTYDQVSANEWLTYTIKRQILEGLITTLYPQDLEFAVTEANFIYYKLKPERLANEAAGINPVDLAEILFKRRPTGKLDKIDVNGFLSWELHPIVLSMAEKSAKGITDFSKQEMITNLDSTADAYKKIIRDKAYLDQILQMIESSKQFYETMSESTVMTEEVGDADDNKPQSDHPVKDALMDIDRELTKGQQKAKKAVQNIQNAGRAAMKPVNRTKAWIGKMIADWKDADETKIKERMADPAARSNLFSAIKWSIKTGSLLKAGLLLNPVFLFLSITRGLGKNKREMRIRNEMIGEIKTEIAIIDEKIKDAEWKRDNAAKYKLMRFKNELNKKLIRVGGDRHMRKMI